MNAVRARELLLSLPHVVQTEQFGGTVFWVGDKVLGGKMVAMMGPELHRNLAMCFAVGHERYHELLEREGVQPAPYLARAAWVVVERWDVLRNSEWQAEFEAAHAVTLAKLAPGARKALALPTAEQGKLAEARRQELAAKADGTKPPKRPAKAARSKGSARTGV